MAWEANEVLARDAAIERIKIQAREEGITGSFKVFYDGNLVANPTDLPEQVDMNKVKVSSVNDNA